MFFQVLLQIVVILAITRETKTFFKIESINHGLDTYIKYYFACFQNLNKAMSPLLYLAMS